MLSTRQQLVKRSFDFALGLVLLIMLWIPFVLIFIFLTLILRRWAWFQQERIGQFGRLFCIYKLRTLRGEAHELGLESLDTNRFGRWIRRTHIDEWPQIVNILKGDMSFVGPRPDLPGYADRLEGEDRMILIVKPGLTGPASLKYSRESDILKGQDYPKTYYREVIWPDKVEINKNYVQSYSFSLDLQLLIQTLFYAFK